MWLPYPSWGIAVEAILPVNPNETASLQIPEREKHIVSQSSRRDTLEGKCRSIYPKPGKAGRMLQSRHCHHRVEEAFWQFCKQPQGEGLKRVSAPAFDKSDAAVEITMVKLLTGFKAVICKTAISLLLVLGFSLLFSHKAEVKIVWCLRCLFSIACPLACIATQLSHCFWTYSFSICCCLPPRRTLISLIKQFSSCHSQLAYLRCIRNAIAR